MFASRSECTRAERLRTVLEGRRHLRQQVIEIVLFGHEPLSIAEAESHLRKLVSDLVVLPAPEKYVAAVPASTLRMIEVNRRCRCRPLL